MTEQARSQLSTIHSELNEVPVGYKQTEVGVIPDDWGVVPLGDCSAYVGSGKTNTKSTGDFPLYGSTGLIGSCTRPEYSGEALLVARVGANAGRLNFVSGEYGVSDNTIIIKLKSDNNIGFFKYWLIRKNLNTLVFGSGQPLITGTQLKDLALPLPSEEEQTAIANALSDVDALISELERLIAKKQAIKTATMQQLLTGRTRLPQFALREDGTKKGIKQSELGEIPEDWGVMTLGTASSFINGRAYSLHEWENSGTPVIRLQNLTGRGDEYYYSNLQLPEKQYCKHGDLLFMWSATFGPVIWRGPKAIYHYHIWKIACEVGYSQSYLFYLLDDMTEKLKRSSSSGGTMLHVTKEKMESTKAAFPSHEEQTSIATILSDMDAEIQALEQRLSKTRQIKQGMMQELLTGRTRLPFDKD